MDLVHNIWDVALLFFWVFASIAYFFALFSVIVDLFRDRSLGGGAKALWFIALVVASVLTTLIYLIVRGQGMAERQAERVQEAQHATESYIQTVAGASPAEEITKAKALLDSGAITAAEYEALKARVLATA
ncbi:MULTISPECIES: SHOCT domain-containing protein [unclassified Cryobacterium]|uniref:SHOCT domain-containing protein n=1 Tax=unclassified Cryobacterium TaxID=2649013 RepID=UPI002AB4AC92|nr:MULTISPECIES: SHOCT domain-containing protein [unclassified Cryobacterium]MDY7542300.1 SHOCT domain-containing protein [Cryobacterium sp. 5B3]MEB0000286.1 SHOCT domain-containing protein [Cryobacterium sp. RTS3]MEB0268040.1 SHOCT domain-containing protein [Cryobacterium sp. 10I5]MEB0275801.1 SHOCT domain-containing protein [Cryobacterium sp. 5B3]